MHGVGIDVHANRIHGTWNKKQRASNASKKAGAVAAGMTVTFSCNTITAAKIRTWTPERHGIGSHAWTAFNPNNNMNPDSIF